MCRDAFWLNYGVSTAATALYRRRIKYGNFPPKEQGNTKNLHAKAIDLKLFVEWYETLATRVGDTGSVRGRRQKTAGGKVIATSHLQTSHSYPPTSLGSVYMPSCTTTKMTRGSTLACRLSRRFASS